MNHSLVRKYVKEEWLELWASKYHDSIRSECVSVKRYAWLDVDKGQVINGSKNEKNLDFFDILENNYGIDKQEQLDPNVGGWRKFAKDFFQPKKARLEKPTIKVDSNQHKRKNGRGWLNKKREWKKLREYKL